MRPLRRAGIRGRDRNGAQFAEILTGDGRQRSPGTRSGSAGALARSQRRTSRRVKLLFLFLFRRRRHRRRRRNLPSKRRKRPELRRLQFPAHRISIIAAVIAAAAFDPARIDDGAEVEELGASGGGRLPELGRGSSTPETAVRSEILVFPGTPVPAAAAEVNEGGDGGGDDGARDGGECDWEEL